MKKIILFVMISFLFMTGCGKKEKIVENDKINNNSNIIKEQTINNLTMKNVLLSYQDGISTFQVQIKNNSTNPSKINRFDIIFKTENGSVITTLNGLLEEEIASSDTMNIIVTSDIDLSEAYSLEYQIR